MNKLEYNVYFEDVNAREIISYNVFNNSRFYNNLVEIVSSYKKNQNLDEFKEKVKNILMYSYWGRSEYEVVITSWPPHVDVEEIDKVKKEIEEHNSKYNQKQFRTCINLNVGKKVSIYDQVMLNFDIFFDYICSNLDNIKKVNGRK